MWRLRLAAVPNSFPCQPVFTHLNTEFNIWEPNLKFAFNIIKIGSHLIFLNVHRQDPRKLIIDFRQTSKLKTFKFVSEIVDFLHSIFLCRNKQTIVR